MERLDVFDYSNVLIVLENIQRSLRCCSILVKRALEQSKLSFATKLLQSSVRIFALQD